MRGHHTFVAVGTSVYQYNRAHLSGKLFDHDYLVKGVFVLGEVLLSFDASNNLKVTQLLLLRSLNT